MTNDPDSIYKESNREKSMRAKKELFWCVCDLNHIGQFGKCEVCGRKSSKKKKKV